MMKQDMACARARSGWPVALALSLILVACGGGEAGTPIFGQSAQRPEPVQPAPPIQPDALPASITLAQQCAPDNPHADAANRSGSLSREKLWLRAYFDEAYLWRDQVPYVNADAYVSSDVPAALDAYFQALKTPQVTPSGARRDQFSFTYPTHDWELLSRVGVSLGYGLEWTQTASGSARRLRIAYVEPVGPAAQAGLQRGDELLSVDGVNANAGDAAGVDRLNAALYPATANELHGFVFQRLAGGQLSVSLGSTASAKQPVLMRQVFTAADGQKVGHMVFNDHIAPAEAQLIEAVTFFKQQAVTDLVLDLRYNGGGFLYLASQLAYMIAGPERSQGKVFEQLSYNSRRQADTQSADARTPFFNTSCLLVGDSCTSERPLPSLGLKRVYVLSQSGTCSASESIINGLRGVGVEVLLIGGRSCGKPYGFSGKSNCGMSYFPIEFVGVNAKGYGDYADGFVPAGSGGNGVPGCQVADDLQHALGDPQEAMLAAALVHRVSGQCPPRSLAQAQSAPGVSDGSGWELKRSPLRSNRFLLPR
nr:S41 family peptidase [uncultured Roseateles sp.]